MNCKNISGSDSSTNSNSNPVSIPYARGYPTHHPEGPPMLNSDDNSIEGLAFIGLSLSRCSDDGHVNTITRQNQYDFNCLQDRQYKYIQSTNDDGWLVGGGESESSYKIPAPDSAHCGMYIVLLICV